MQSCTRAEPNAASRPLQKTKCAHASHPTHSTPGSTLQSPPACKLLRTLDSAVLHRPHTTSPPCGVRISNNGQATLRVRQLPQQDALHAAPASSSANPCMCVMQCRCSKWYQAEVQRQLRAMCVHVYDRHSNSRPGVTTLLPTTPVSCPAHAAPMQHNLLLRPALPAVSHLHAFNRKAKVESPPKALPSSPLYKPAAAYIQYTGLSTEHKKRHAPPDGVGGRTRSSTNKQPRPLCEFREHSTAFEELPCMCVGAHVPTTHQAALCRYCMAEMHNATPQIVLGGADRERERQDEPC
jgi:hypothetical protein